MSGCLFTGQQLRLKITETTALADISTGRGICEQLRATGVALSMDDFGAGQSTLKRLRELPIDEVKIDRAFVADLDRDDARRRFTWAVIAFAVASASPWSPRASNTGPSWMRSASSAARCPGFPVLTPAPPRRRHRRALDPCAPPAQRHFPLHQRCDPWVRSRTPEGTNHRTGCHPFTKGTLRDLAGRAVQAERLITVERAALPPAGHIDLRCSACAKEPEGSLREKGSRTGRSVSRMGRSLTLLRLLSAARCEPGQ